LAIQGVLYSVDFGFEDGDFAVHHDRLAEQCHAQRRQPPVGDVEGEEFGVFGIHYA